jgi:hypothetical protein
VLLLFINLTAPTVAGIPGLLRYQVILPSIALVTEISVAQSFVSLFVVVQIVCPLVWSVSTAPVRLVKYVELSADKTDPFPFINQVRFVAVEVVKFVATISSVIAKVPPFAGNIFV